MIGTVSYEDRQQVREAKREELEATIQAHIELGSIREEAIAATLSNLTVPVPPVIKAVSELPAQQTISLSVNDTAWDKTQRTAFSFAAGNALVGLPFLLTLGYYLPRQFQMYDVLVGAMAVIPATAGAVLGYLSPSKAVKAWSRASLLTLPLITLSYLALVWYGWHFASARNFMPILIVGTAHAVVSALFGSMGAWFGEVCRKQLAPLRSKRALNVEIQ